MSESAALIAVAVFSILSIALLASRAALALRLIRLTADLEASESREYALRHEIGRRDRAAAAAAAEEAALETVAPGLYTTDLETGEVRLVTDEEMAEYRAIRKLAARRGIDVENMGALGRGSRLGIDAAEDIMEIEELADVAALRTV